MVEEPSPPSIHFPTAKTSYQSTSAAINSCVNALAHSPAFNKTASSFVTTVTEHSGNLVSSNYITKIAESALRSTKSSSANAPVLNSHQNTGAAPIICQV